MSDECRNCGQVIRAASTFKSANERRPQHTVDYVNFINGSAYSELCTKCGEDPLVQAYEKINVELAEKTVYCRDNITDFPMFTMSWMPSVARIELKSMITANITVGTGLFSEFSQGFSDMFGLVNENSGMSLKVNKGEASARSILVMKAAAMQANCIVGVDIDYGTTGNNSATINMQGTAAVITNLEDVMSEPEYQKAAAFHQAQMRIAQLRRWKNGSISA